LVTVIEIVVPIVRIVVSEAIVITGGRIVESVAAALPDLSVHRIGHDMVAKESNVLCHHVI